MSTFQKLDEVVHSLSISEVSEDRKLVLQPLIDYLREKRKEGEPIALNFICTHNSRRSHLCQIWAQTMAFYHRWFEVTTYSAGTSATAVFPSVLEALQDDGFEMQTLCESENPLYAVRYGNQTPPIVAFSKGLDHAFNPSAQFCAVMTCAEADGACPFVPGAEKRIPITYIDPKMADGTEQQKAVYHERSRQIATEMAYVFHAANEQS